MPATRHQYETFVRATPAEVWRAITDPDFTRRYFHGTRFETDLAPGSGHRYVTPDGRDAVDGTIEEVEPGRRLVMTWHVLYDTAMAEEPPSRVEWVLTPANDDGSVTRVTLRHLDLGLSPLTSANVELGWLVVLDGMKTLVETGEPLGAVDLDAPTVPDDHDQHRRLAATANGEAWELLGKLGDEPASEEEAFELLARAWAAAYHWRRAASPDAPQQARAAWLLSRASVVAGDVDAALRHAERCAQLTAASAAAADFDHAYAHEARARALAAAGSLDEAAAARRLAIEIAIADDEDREIVEADLASGPWFGLAT
jgi:uncharacterized protein YndB with AHSA1/START domain